MARNDCDRRRRRRLWVCVGLFLRIAFWSLAGLGVVFVTASSFVPGQGWLLMAAVALAGVLAFLVALHLAMRAAWRLDVLLDVDPCSDPPRGWLWSRLNMERMWVLPYTDDPGRYAGMTEQERAAMHDAICRRLLGEASEVLAPYGGRVYGVQIVIDEDVDVDGQRPWTPEAYALVKRQLSDIGDSDLRPPRRVLRGDRG